MAGFPSAGCSMLKNLIAVGIAHGPNKNYFIEKLGIRTNLTTIRDN